jgi:GNAT superfamily N-acetyltransferase
VPGDQPLGSLPLVVRPIARDDLPTLERHIDQDFGNRDKHRRRLALQEEGRATYLVAWLAGLPVGHALLRWEGAADEPVRSALPGCADVEDLFVVPGLRSRGIGSRLLEAVERLAGGRGCARIGMSVDVANVRARELYEHRGYRDVGLGTFVLHGTWVDRDGSERAWAETCTYLVKPLRSPRWTPTSSPR